MKESLKSRSSSRGATVQVTPQPLRVKLPEVNVDLGDPQVNVELRGLVEIMAQLAAQMATVSQQIAAAEARQAAALEELAAALKARRPGSFYVELDKEGDETVGMRIRTGGRGH